jgi:integrase
MNFTEVTRTVEFNFPLVSEETLDALDDQHARARVDYKGWKRAFLEWLHFEGKDPERLRGYADTTVRKTSYNTDQIMRWLWNRRGYTTEFSTDDADELMREMGRYSSYSDAHLNSFVKTIKRIFSYYNTEKGEEIEWDCQLHLHEPKVTNRDYFKRDEFCPLYEASLEHGAVRNYHSCTPEERAKVKGHLAQRFEKPKGQIGPSDFERANTFKTPSIVATSLDCGLRPVEVGRARVDWVNFDDRTLDIPKEQSSKNKDNWKCVLSERSIRSLNNWIDERSRYNKYGGREELWLNRVGNPLDSKALNYLLNQLIESAGIRPAGRDLSWYSIRHGVATLWADEEDIHHAREQLRHRSIETTLGYAHSDASRRHNTVNSKW